MATTSPTKAVATLPAPSPASTGTVAAPMSNGTLWLYADALTHQPPGRLADAMSGDPGDRSAQD